MAGRKKRTIIGLVGLVVLAAGITAAIVLTRGSPADTAAGGEQIFTIEAKTGTVSVRVEGPSFIEPYRSQEMRSRTAGTVISAPVEGDSAAEGDILIRFDRTDQENAVKQAELNLAQARLDLRKTELTLKKAGADLDERKRLYSSGAVSKDQVDAAQDALAAAELSLGGARIKVDQSVLALDKAASELDGTIIAAPFDGIVLKSYISAGDLANSGGVLLSFADLSRVRLRAEVDEFDIGQVRPGMSVSVTSDTLGDEVVKSKVERISPSAEIVNNISIFTVSTVLPNDDGVFRPGMSADLSILISSDKGIVVPTKAVSTVRGRSYVKVYEDEEVVTKRVTIGANDGVNTAVMEGLAEGAVVVLPQTAGLTLTSTQTTSGTSIVPITVPGTGGR